MSATIPCVPCCSTPLSVSVPGAQGETGAAGAAGCNAVSVLAAGVNITGVAATAHTLTVDDTCWMAVGQVVVMDGPVHLQVVSVVDDTTVSVIELAYTGDVTGAIAAGVRIAPAGVQGELVDSLSVYGAGTAYEMTATAALINLGTTPLSLTISQAGTYVLSGFVQVDFNGATFAAVRNLICKLRRTNNTPADIANTSVTTKLPIVTTLDHTAALVTIPPVVYPTANTDDVIQLFGSISVVPTAGTLDAVDGWIFATRINSSTT